jgi:hypothetical protein
MALDLGIEGIVCWLCEEPIEPTDEIAEGNDPVEDHNVWGHEACWEDLAQRLGIA